MSWLEEWAADQVTVSLKLKIIQVWNRNKWTRSISAHNKIKIIIISLILTQGQSAHNVLSYDPRCSSWMCQGMQGEYLNGICYSVLSGHIRHHFKLKIQSVRLECIEFKNPLQFLSFPTCNPITTPSWFRDMIHNPKLQIINFVARLIEVFSYRYVSPTGPYGRPMFVQASTTLGSGLPYIQQTTWTDHERRSTM